MLQHSSITSTTAMASSSVLQDRQRHVGPNVALSYAQPIHMVSGRGCYLYDEDQQRYLDCVNNVAHVGHANEAVSACSPPPHAQFPEAPEAPIERDNLPVPATCTLNPSPHALSALGVF
jgi:hypothetical protein